MPDTRILTAEEVVLEIHRAGSWREVDQARAATERVIASHEALRAAREEAEKAALATIDERDALESELEKAHECFDSEREARRVAEGRVAHYRQALEGIAALGNSTVNFARGQNEGVTNEEMLVLADMAYSALAGLPDAETERSRDSEQATILTGEFLNAHEHADQLREALDEVHEFHCGCDQPGRLGYCVATPTLVFASLSSWPTPGLPDAEAAPDETCKRRTYPEPGRCPQGAAVSSVAAPEAVKPRIQSFADYCAERGHVIGLGHTTREHYEDWRVSIRPSVAAPKEET